MAVGIMSWAQEDGQQLDNALRRHNPQHLPALERNHQGLGNQLITLEPDIGSRSGQVRRRKRLGGLLSYYDRDAA